MEEKIIKLYEKILRITESNLDYHKRGKQELIKSAILEIYEYSVWFFKENHFDIEIMLYQDLCVNLNQILADIVSGYNQKDYVLLHDALAYGLLEYLNMIVAEESETDEHLRTES